MANLTIPELKALLGTVVDPKSVAYHHFPSAPTTPYVTFAEQDPEIIFADGLTYFVSQNYAIELYTSVKHPPTEQLLEETLTAHEIPWEKLGSLWLKDERIYQTVYYI